MFHMIWKLICLVWNIVFFFARTGWWVGIRAIALLKTILGFGTEVTQELHQQTKVKKDEEGELIKEVYEAVAKMYAGLKLEADRDIDVLIARYGEKRVLYFLRQAMQKQVS